MKPQRYLSAALLVGFLVAGSSPALGQSNGPAAQHYDAAVRMFDDNDYSGALSEFKRVYEIQPNNGVLFNIGQCYFQLHDYSNAATTLRKFISEGGVSVPADRRDLVERELSDLRARVGTLSLQTNVPGATVTIDGNSAGTGPFTGRVVNVGRRVVTVSAPNHPSTTKEVDVTGGEETRTTIDLADAPPARDAAPESDRAAPAQKSGSNSWLVYGGFGLAGVGVAVGSVFGILALGNKSTLDSACKAKICPSSKSSDVDAVKRNATLSTVGFAVGLVGAGIAIYGLVSSPKRDAASASLTVGPSSVAVSGRF